MEPQKDAKGPAKPPARPAPETLAAETTVRPPNARSPGPRSHIGRFRIQRVLGEGAFGCVFLATDTELGRLVAIKVPHPEALTPPLRERFLREARATATIHHPNVCPVFEVGVDRAAAGSAGRTGSSDDGELPFIVMHYVEGGTLATHLATHKVMAPRPAVALAQRLALGIAAAHEKGVVHRDLKPSNILFDPTKMLAVITDFGLAMLVAETRMTADGKVNGTPLYMSPEQARGRTGEIGPLSDVYSLGVILFHMLTGDVPFTGSVFEVLAQHADAPPPRPSQVRAGLDPRLDALVTRAMAKRPADRYSSAKAFADALDDYSRGGPIVPPSAGSGARKPLPPAPAPPPTRSTPPAPAVRPSAPAPRAVTAPPPARRVVPPPIPRRPTAPVLELPPDDPPAPKPRSRRRLNARLVFIAAVLLTTAVTLGVFAVQKWRTADQRADAAAASAAGKSAGDLYVMKFGSPQQELRFRWIPPGTFQMGSPADGTTGRPRPISEMVNRDDERPVHTVVIGRGFWMAETETTQAQWKAVMGANPSKVQGDNLPVEFVAWNDAREFCSKLAATSGKSVTLPTEAQWEYACRAGTTTAYHSGDSPSDLLDVAWTPSNSARQIHPVGQKKANAWGLRDMHGNVNEFCLDGKRQYNFGTQTDPVGLIDPESPRPIIRGGSYYHDPATAVRGTVAATQQNDAVGFRVCFRPE